MFNSKRTYKMNALNTTNTAPTVAKLNPANVTAPIPVIIRRDPAGNMCAFLKDTLKLNPDNTDEGTLGVWFEGRQQEVSYLPLDYYTSTKAVSETEEAEFAQKFGKEYGAPFGVAIKKRVAKDKAHLHRKALGAQGIVENQNKMAPRPQNERSTDVVSSKDDMQLKLQIVLEALPNAIAVALQAAMQQSVMPAVKAAVDGVLQAVFDPSTTQH
jgi:hypothetical protein